MSYNEVQIEPNSYEIELGIPRQPLFFKFRYPGITEISKLASGVYKELPKEIRDRLNPKSDNAIYGSAERRLDFIKPPPSTQLTTEYVTVAKFKTRLAKILFLKDSGISIDKIRFLFFKLTDENFAIHLQFLRDNGIEI